MRNLLSNGSQVRLLAPYALSTGDGVQIGSLFGVAAGAAAIGGLFDMIMVGEVRITAVSSDTGAVGTPMYWDNTARALTTTAGANMCVGVLTSAKTSGQTQATIRLVDGDGNQVASFALTTTTTTGATTLTTAALQRVTLGGTHQLTMPASPGAVAGSFVLLLTCAGFTPTWSGVTWLTSSGVAPTLNTVAGKRNAITFIWDNSLPGWLGFLSGVQA